MRYFIILSFFILNINLIAQQEKGSFKKGSFFLYWGYNREHYSKSDITFKGNDFNFKISDVHASDRQTKFGIDPYFKIDQITIPQYNYRVGYFFNHKYNISLGWDHMKYVMNQDQSVKINGYIHNTGTIYDKEYNNENIVLSGDFLQFEHTDGLNYINAELTRNDYLLNLHKNIELSSYYGLGTGIVYPRTRSSIVNKGINDEWHVSGYGLSAKTGINLLFFKHFFIAGEAKAGTLNLPSVLITSNSAEKGKHHFSFLQLAFSFGYRFML